MTLATEVRPPRGAAGIAIIDPDGKVTVDGSPGALSGFYEAGSLTKTFTATLLASLVLDGLVALDTTVGDILGARAGAATDVRLVELATHTSGLPRLAKNAITLPFWPRDPYRFYDAPRLYKGLAATVPSGRGTIAYSNLGFQLLGHCLAEATETPFNELLRTRVFLPAGMTTARCQPCSRKRLLRGHGSLVLGGRRWHDPLPGAGGVDCTIADLAAWLRANAQPASTPLERAVLLCHEVHAESGDSTIGLSWHYSGPVLWHNGATGCFQGAIAFTPAGMGAAGLASSGLRPSYSIDRIIVSSVKERADFHEPGGL